MSGRLELPEDFPSDGFVATFPNGPHHLLFCQYPDEPEPRLYECGTGGNRRRVQMADGRAAMMMTASQRLFVAACWSASADLRGESQQDVAAVAGPAVLTAIEWDIRLAQAFARALTTPFRCQEVDAEDADQTKAYYDRLEAEHDARFGPSDGQASLAV